jgi:copper transport protein
MRIVLLLLLGFLALVAASASASAHASLLRSIPADGAVLAEVPKTLELTFNEPVSPIVMRLIEPDGAGSDLSQVQAHDESVVVIAPHLKAGTHALSWRVISADGHPVGGSIVFSIGAPSASGIAVRTGTPRLLMAAIWLARFVLYVGLFVGVGGRFFEAWIAGGRCLPTPAELVLDACLVAGLLAAFASLGLQGLDVLGVGFPGLADRATWQAALATSYAATLGLAAVALLLALVSSRVGSIRLARCTTALAVVAIGAALALSGHAGDAPPQMLTRPAVFVHAACVTLWVGSLFPLAALAWAGGAASTESLTLFSRIIPLPVLLLVASGLVLAIVQVADVTALWATPYGLVFDAKITAVAGLLCIAAWNRFWLTPRIETNDAAARGTMVRSIAAEAVLIAIILGLVTTWRFTPPPRAMSMSASQANPIQFHVHTARAMADVSITPGRVGPVVVSISIESGDFGPLEAKGVTLTLSNPTAGIEPIRREARHVDGVAWRIDGLTIPAAGTWIGKIDILVTDFDQITLQDQFPVPR